MYMGYTSGMPSSVTGPTIFLLSPAHAGGRRARLLLSDTAEFPLARRLRDGGRVPLGEVFSFVSGLYFRGKLAYATRFSTPGSGVYVITTDRGLLSSDTPISLGDLRDFSDLYISADDPRYREALERDVSALPASRVIFLGSIATPKYLGILGDILEDRLFYPAAFVGLGDMSRGSMLLRAVHSGEELEYLPVTSLPRAARRSRRHG